MMEDMRLALTEQEETQSQMEEMLEDKLHLIQELSDGKTNSWTDCSVVIVEVLQKHFFSFFAPLTAVCHVDRQPPDSLRGCD